MFVYTTHLQLSWSLKALPASPHCSSRDLVCPVIPLNVELPHKHHLLHNVLRIVTIWVPCWDATVECCSLGMKWILPSCIRAVVIICKESSWEQTYYHYFIERVGVGSQGPHLRLQPRLLSYTPLCKLTMWSYLGLQKIAMAKCTWFLDLLWEGKLIEVDI